MWKRILIVLLTALLAACATSPTGRSQFILMSDAEMSQMGAQAFQQIRKEETVSHDRRLQNYVECVAHGITGQLSGEEGKTEWEVVVFKDDQANAFALPGGKIGVYTGLLDVAKSQGQLAAVLGHEVGHVLARHGAERVSQQFAASTALQLVGSYIGDGSSNSSKLAMSLLGLGAQVGVLLPYSRIQESEADTIGLGLMADAGFDPRQSIQLWQNMEKQGGARPPEFLSTHPDPENRIQNLQQHMPDALDRYQKARQSGLRPDCG